MTSFHMVAARSAEREKCIERSGPNATTANVRDGAGKVQHAWKALRNGGLNTRGGVVPARVVSLLRVFLLAFVIGSVACASATPGTIGALLGKRTDGRLFVRGVPAGEGADRAGVEVDDEIVAINGRAVGEMSEEDIRKAVRGDVGSSLLITVERGGQRRNVKIERSPILADPAAGKGK
jgi:carboxyl-terminal processing protease